MDKLEVMAIIPTYNMKGYLNECLTSLYQQTYKKFEIVVVVNEAGDGTKEMLEQEFPEINIIYNRNRLGIEHSRNIAIKNSSSRYIASLDADTKVTQNWLEELVKAITRHEGIGMCSCKILNYHQPNMIDNIGHALYYDFSPIHIGQDEDDGGQFDIKREVFGVCLAGCLIKREVFDKIGFFDEDYIRSFDDWSWRARLEGYKCLYVPSAVAYHKGITTNSLNKRNIFLWERNRILSLLKHYPFRAIIISIFYTLKRYLKSLTKGRMSIPIHQAFIAVLYGCLEALKLLPKFTRKRRYNKLNSKLSIYRMRAYIKKNW